jgi:hypothetical protein
LAENDDAEGVCDAFKRFDIGQRLDLMGPSEWEALALAYLIYEENFVPVCLAPGKTLPVLDLVGNSRMDGRQILAQCKKDQQPVEIDSEFLEIVFQHSEQARFYYFAFGGVRTQQPPVRVIDRGCIRKWLDEHTDYASLLWSR